MLETYYEEVAKKRRQRNTFWITVWVFATFLYLFFQGYYPYFRFDIAKLLERQETEKPQVVRAFGIVNVKSEPKADRIEINTPTQGVKPFLNDEKGFFDFGTYGVSIEKAGYLGLKTTVELDKENSFSITSPELFKVPRYSEFIVPFESADPLTDDRILIRESVTSTGKTASGTTAIYRILDRDFAIDAIFRTDARHIGEGYFVKNGAISMYDEETRSLKTLKTKLPTGTGCADALLESGEIKCPKAGVSLPIHSPSIKDRLLGRTGRIVRTENATFRIDRGRILSKENVKTATGSVFQGNLLLLWKKPYYLKSGTLASADSAKPLSIPSFDSVASVHEFGNEAIILGYSGDTAMFAFVNSRGTIRTGAISKSKISDLKIERIGGAFVISDGKASYLYYESASNLHRLVEGETLGIFGDTVFFRKNSKTYRMLLEHGK